MAKNLHIYYRDFIENRENNAFIYLLLNKYSYSFKIIFARQVEHFWLLRCKGKKTRLTKFFVIKADIKVKIFCNQNFA